jgi:D-sedoheptulose 7-phosphate isomerase
VKQWISNYLRAQKAAHDSIPVDAVAELIGRLRSALQENRQIFVFGNGGSAANASHFATDLGKGASDKVGKRFRVLSLNDNVSWMTALANDYAYEDIFVGQLQNYGQPGDLAMSLSVSGNSPNCVKALAWAKQHGLHTVALVGTRRGRMAEIAEQVIVINDTHYGRVEDAQMSICHLLCYAFMENPERLG